MLRACSSRATRLESSSGECRRIRLDWYTVRDLLFHLPRRYDDLREMRSLGDLIWEPEGSIISARATVADVRVEQGFRKRTQRTIARLEDRTGSIDATWFGRRFIERRLRVGGDPRRVAQCLAAIPGVTPLDAGLAESAIQDGERGARGSVPDRAGRLYVVELHPATTPDRLAAAVVGGGLALEELREEPTDLEALFLRLTGEGPGTHGARPGGSASGAGPGPDARP